MFSLLLPTFVSPIMHDVVSEDMCRHWALSVVKVGLLSIDKSQYYASILGVFGAQVYVTFPSLIILGIVNMFNQV
jgi:hypothetical protein